MAREKVCPRCGRTSREVPFIGNLCRDCYVEVYGIASLPSRVEFVYCKYCGRYKYQGEWFEPSDPTLEGTLRDYLFMVLSRRMKKTEHIDEAWIESIDFINKPGGPGLYRARVAISGRSGDVTVGEEKIVEVQVNVGVCPLCTNKITKRGYEAIVQVRSSSGRLGEDLRSRVDAFLAEELSEQLKDTIISVEEHREGFDLLLSDPTAAKIIASKLRSNFMAKTVETYKLVGRKPDGSRKGRLTISVRIPEIRPGDVIRVGGRLHLFLATSRRGAPVLVDLQTGREYTARPDYLWRKGFEPYEGGMETARLLLLSVTPRSVLFSDAGKNYDEIIDFPREKVKVYVEDFTPGKIYKAIIVGGRAYVIGVEKERV
ncbi:MAG: hypothetical protein LRS48_00820 [Desulfurococcales archaeon]|nr:hypothetical protein [Desulfurococcales archaeon]